MIIMCPSCNFEYDYCLTENQLRSNQVAFTTNCPSCNEIVYVIIDSYSISFIQTMSCELCGKVTPIDEIVETKLPHCGLRRYLMVCKQCEIDEAIHKLDSLLDEEF